MRWWTMLGVCRLYSSLFLIFLLTTTKVWADLPQEIKEGSCYPAIEIQHQNLIKTPKWFRDIGSADGVRTYRAPTNRVGTWLELRVLNQGPTTLIIRSWDWVQSFIYALPNCFPEVRKSAIHYRNDFQVVEFSDAHLNKILKSHSSGIIYAWSPSMPFSVQGGKVIKSVAKRLHIPVFFVLDPHAEPRLAQKGLRELGGDTEALRSLQSVELFQRGVGVHFPAIVLFENHKIIGPSLPGVKREEVYMRLIQERLAPKRDGR